MTFVKEIFDTNNLSSLEIEISASKISAGFPSPADDFIERKLDLNDYLINHPASSFLVRVGGDSMINAGILENDILIVDKSLQAIHSKIVIAIIDNDLTVKRLYKKNGKIMLIPENENYLPITFENEQQLQIWGVVTGMVRKF
ncbi:MAG: translesion error-prone DNA polymerase V autoproteolytic subunit [Sphingobacteriia bacterium]|nr:translesion error-prone DNA polymerase V autoproteolytic subunit [Sphingobacteriia bacterium]